jgi:putative hydrolase of the HAD superfamily
MPVILFDLGGVLVDFRGVAAVAGLSGGRLSIEQSRRFWMTSPAVAAFETGGLPVLEFARRATRELGLTLPPEEFLAQFETWDGGPLPGALELLDELRPRRRLACLTNNNEIHWRHLRDGLHRHFERCYVSYELGLRKPDAAVFEHVVRDLAVAPPEILFLDDNPECVTAGARAGLVCRLVKGVEEARRACLESLVSP